jgi:hypothetical protein
MTTTSVAPERQEIEEMLPWHAAGTLNRRDAHRVEQAIAVDPELARQFALVREELSDTIKLNESLGAPSARAMERLFAGIEAESGPARQARQGFSFGAWLSEKLDALSPRTLAWSGATAALAIALQFGLLASLYVGGQGSKPGFQTASRPEVSQPVSGSYVLISFVADASISEITEFLERNKMTVVDGPRAGGIYRVRVASVAVSRDEAERIVTRIREDGGIVRFAAPTE